MTWINAGVINPSRNWQYTNAVKGDLFRLSHNYSDLPTEYFQAELTQIEENEDGTITTFGYQVIEASPTSEVIRLTKPECFSNRKIAIRQLSRDVDLPPAGRVYSWAIGIEAYDPTEPPPPPPPPPNTGTYSSTPATLLGSTGMALLSSTPKDDELVNLPDIGFDFPFFGSNHRTDLKVSSNSSVGIPLTTATGLANAATVRGISISHSDGVVVNLYGQASENSYRIRFEGSITYTSYSISRVWELTLFKDGAIQLVTGEGCTIQPSFISNGSTSTSIPVQNNSSYVITFPDGSPVIQSGSYSF